MPKTRQPKVRGSQVKPNSIRHKFKIGTRKSGKSAHLFSTTELLNKYFSPSLPKDKHKIGQVLRFRNVIIPDSLEKETTEE